MAGICNSCKYFRFNAHPDLEKKHHCDFQNVALNEEEARQNCEECVPKGKGCCH